MLLIANDINDFVPKNIGTYFTGGSQDLDTAESIDDAPLSPNGAVSEATHHHAAAATGTEEAPVTPGGAYGDHLSRADLVSLDGSISRHLPDSKKVNTGTLHSIVMYIGCFKQDLRH